MIARAWYVKCDRCGNPADISTESAASAKEYARADGFVVVNRQWLCPGCASELEQEPRT